MDMLKLYSTQNTTVTCCDHLPLLWRACCFFSVFPEFHLLVFCHLRVYNSHTLSVKPHQLSFTLQRGYLFFVHKVVQPYRLSMPKKKARDTDMKGVFWHQPFPQARTRTHTRPRQLGK